MDNSNNNGLCLSIFEFRFPSDGLGQNSVLRWSPNNANLPDNSREKVATRGGQRGALRPALQFSMSVYHSRSTRCSRVLCAATQRATLLAQVDFGLGAEVAERASKVGGPGPRTDALTCGSIARVGTPEVAGRGAAVPQWSGGALHLPPCCRQCAARYLWPRAGR
jgi:hypothetical protein